LGITLESLFGVKDFDDDVVHGKEYWKKNYFYDTVWKKLAPVLSVAIANKRRQKPVLSLTSMVQRVVESQYKASESIKEPKYKYFSAKEAEGLKPELMELLDEARGLSGIPFAINSGYRTKKHNKKVGGVENSTHLTGGAADIRCRNSSERWKIVTAALEVGFTRIGIGETFVHLGFSPDKAQEQMWDYYK
jgi:hypothetical protein